MKKKALKINWERYYPLGYEHEAERGFFGILLGWASLWGVFGFFSRMERAVSYAGDGHSMADFYKVLGNALFWFPIVILIMLAAIIMHYAHHHSGSKSIYTMRRLPDRWELHRRCIAAPAVSVLISIGVAALLFFIFYGVYMLCIQKHGYHPHAKQLKLLLENWNLMYWREF